MSNFTPLYDNIIVKHVKEPDVTTSGIYLSNPDVDKEYSEGVVVAIGNGHKTSNGDIIPLRVSVGDTVIYRKMVEVQIRDGGEEFFIISENNIFAIKS